MTPTTRARIIERRTYNRPLDEAGTLFETTEQMVDRVIAHQHWLWERAHGGRHPNMVEELSELRQLILERRVMPAGRTMWLGGTEVARRREASNFNCSFTTAETVHDIVDIQWNLLQGCGVGFQPVPGTLNGFAVPIEEIEVIRSTRTSKGGRETNHEHWNPDTRTWVISVGDSAEAWAKAVGKLLAGKYPAKKLIFDFSEIRPSGQRLRGYGWISSGDAAIAKAFVAIAEIMNRRADQMLTKIDILDVVNWMGTILSSRRSAEIALVDFESSEWEEFALAKKDHFDRGLPQRSQSNNSLVFHRRPSKIELWYLFDLIAQGGGSEPGMVNAEAARRRAPWWRGLNPCAEILLGNHNYCNLVETDLSKFNGRFTDLLRAHYLIARANYRQTCVDLDDGILQRSWHELNQFLRLTGTGVTGVVKWEGQHDPEMWALLRQVAHQGVNSMADELGLPRSKAVTTVKPSGTVSKFAGTLEYGETPEGCHRPIGRYIFNNVNYSTSDPLVEVLRKAGYWVRPNPSDPSNTLVTLPVDFSGVEFDVVNGREVNLEPAVEQLNRYRMLMDNYVDHNCSITVYYDKEEVPSIVDWLQENWDHYVGVSFLYRTDPTKTAEDLGYKYLPQQVVTEEEFRDYVKGLKPIDLNEANSLDEIENDECVAGVCPVR